MTNGLHATLCYSWHGSCWRKALYMTAAGLIVVNETLMATMATGLMIPVTSGPAWPGVTREQVLPRCLPSELLKGGACRMKSLMNMCPLPQPLLPSREFG